ncbi:MAG: glutamate-5-semialdehyde dehydrogenase [Geminicoccaceae bacterium]
MATVLKVELEREMQALGDAARAASQILAQAPRAAKDKALLAAAAALRDGAPVILAANARDMAAARAKNLASAMLDRLQLDPKRVEAMAVGLETIAALDDPIGAELARWGRPNGLDIARVRVPLGVVGIIYESRPNVTADAGALCLKAGNAAVLRGGSESFHSSQAIGAALAHGLAVAGLPAAAIQLVPTTDRAAVGMLLRMSEHIDVIVPRGGRSLIERVLAESRVPVLAHLEGNCHVYVHGSADPAMAVDLAVNGKMRRTGVCGSTETLLVDLDAAPRLLPPILDALIAAGCAIRGDAVVQRLEPRATAASERDWYTEYLDAILAVKTVAGLDEAVAHVNHYGSHHTDCIVATDADAAGRFLREVDSAIVIHNASTQFADGGEFGMGAEIGIATGRLHARGPVGVEQLTSYKYLVRGTGQTRPG